MAAARIVGPTGLVYATEIGAAKVRRLQQKDESGGQHPGHRGHRNLYGLPAGGCDSIFLRDVYHHLTQPAATDASLFEALRPGGRLAIIDFPPNRFLSWFVPVKGVPTDRGGHGVPRDVVAIA